VKAEAFSPLSYIAQEVLRELDRTLEFSPSYRPDVFVRTLWLLMAFMALRHYQAIGSIVVLAARP